MANTPMDINIIDYGAVGDDTTASDVAINNALSHVRAVGGGTIRIPAGKYLCNAPINGTGFTNNSGTQGTIHICGDGPSASILRSTFSNNPVLDLTGSSTIRLSNFGIQNKSGIPTELLLLARDSTNASAGDHVLDNMLFIGSCSHAPIVNIGSEQNLWLHVAVLSNNDGPAFIGTMTSVTPPAGNGTPAGWSPSSSFTAIGTGQGGTGANQFVDCTFIRFSINPPTTALLYVWGMAVTQFRGCFFANRGTTVDMRGIPQPVTPSAHFDVSAIFDSCADENIVAESKNSILFSYPGYMNEPSVTGCQVRACLFFGIFGEDNTWVENLHLYGGHTGYLGQVIDKVSIWRLDNAYIFPSFAERSLGYAVRNQASGIILGGIPANSVSLPFKTSFLHLDTDSGNVRAQRFSALNES